LLWDRETSEYLAGECDKQVVEINEQLSMLFPDVLVNWSSPEQLSSVLFGGKIIEKYQEDFEFVYKNGKTKMKQRWAQREYVLPGFFEPNPKTKLQKEGQYSTEEGVLQKILNTKTKPKKGLDIIRLVLRRKGIEKLKGTYYNGFNNRIQSMDWDGNYMHTTFNHSLTDTGRLSSMGRNIQNIPEEARQCVVSRF
jgi:DNA polymerase I-like protein with 3'-5' exonuclease and polymerase domains